MAACIFTGKAAQDIDGMVLMSHAPEAKPRTHYPTASVLDRIDRVRLGTYTFHKRPVDAAVVRA